MHGLGGCNLGDCGCVTPHIGYRRWGHTLDCRHVTPVQSHPGDCGHRIPGAGSGRWLTLETVTSDARYIGSWITLETVDMLPQVQGLERGSPWRLWTCDPRYSFWESVTLDSGHVTPSAGFGNGFILVTGHMSPGAGYGQEGHPGYCRSVTPGTGSGHSLTAQKLPP